MDKVLIKMEEYKYTLEGDITLEECNIYEDGYYETSHKEMCIIVPFDGGWASSVVPARRLYEELKKIYE